VYANEAETNDGLHLPIPMSVPEARENQLKSAKPIPPPKTQREVLWYLRILQDPTFASLHRFPTSRLWGLYAYLKDIVSKLAQRAVDSYDEWQQCLIANWVVPAFVVRAAEEKQAKLEEARLNDDDDSSTVPKKRKNRGGKAKAKSRAKASLEELLGQAPVPTVSAASAARNNNPTRTSTAEEWAAHLVSPRGAKMKLVGVHKRSDGAFNMRSIRGRILITSRRPDIPNGAIPLHAARYMILAAEVVARPGYYRSLVESGQITVSSVVSPPTPLPEYMNITTVDVAREFASQGLTIEDVEDAALFAATWIGEYHPQNEDIVIAMRMLRLSLPPLLRVPPGRNEDHWAPATGLQNYPSIVLSARVRPDEAPQPVASSSGQRTSSSAPPARVRLPPSTANTVVLNYGDDSATTAEASSSSAPVPDEGTTNPTDASQQMDET
jgi:hypothetical protein